MPRFPTKPMLMLSLCVLAASALAAPSAPPPLLHKGSRPPLFALPNTFGQTVRLDTFLGRKRIVLLAIPDGGGLPYDVFLRAVVRHRAEFAQRDLVVLILTTPQSGLFKEFGAPPLHTLRDDSGKIAHSYGGSPNAPAFYLIGKDGGIKMARRTSPTLRELFAAIDAMPMRRDEIRQRGR